MILLAAALAAYLATPQAATFACTVARMNGTPPAAGACTDADEDSSDDTPPKPGEVMLAAG